MRVAFFVLTALAAVGVFLSLELVGVHLGTHYGDGGDTALCQALEGYSCEAASKSSYSELFGFPIAGIGGVFYLVVLLAALLARFSKDEGWRRGWQNILVGGGLAAVGYSIFLAIISFTQLDSPCPLCLGLYVVNIGILAAALIAHDHGVGQALKGLPSMLLQPPFSISVVIMAVGVVGAQSWYANVAQAARMAKMTRPAQPDKSFDISTDGIPGKGPADAKVVVVEFSDFECPYCGRLTDALKEAQATYKDVRIHFRHYPMDHTCNPNLDKPFHKHACEAAKAAVCADKLGGRFWPMHDWLFKNARNLSTTALQQHAAGIGLDPEALAQCMADPKTVELIRDDVAAGSKVGVRGTPTFLVNGKVFVGARTPEELVQIFSGAAKQ